LPRTHDPRTHIESLRNHLASPDASISFLFGAGTSSSVNLASPQAGKKSEYKPLIPSVAALTELCRAEICKKGDAFSKAWDSAKAELIGTTPQPNIEDILSAVRRKLDAAGLGDKLLGLDISQLREFESSIRSTIAVAVSPKEDSIPSPLPHDGFSLWLKSATRRKPIELFTTNYDILFEASFERLRIPSFDGFVGTLHPFFRADFVERDDLLPGSSVVRLWKVHGSVYWDTLKDSFGSRIVRRDTPTGGALILPSHLKYDESRRQPYLAYLDRLRSQLDKDDSILISCGFSYSDQHINAVIFDVLENRPRAHVVALVFGSLEPDSPVVKAARRLRNLLVLARNGAIVGGQEGSWQLIEPIDASTATFMDPAFDSNAAPSSIDEAQRGEFRLGDFVWLARFLETMQ